MRWLAFLVCGVIIFCQGCFPAVAQDVIEDTPILTSEEVVLQGLTCTQETIDVSSFRLSVADGMQLYADIFKQNPQLFHVSREISYTYNHDGTLLALYPSYILTGAALEKARDTYVQSIQQLQVEAYQIKENWLEFEKVLFIHDHLASLYTYSPTGQEIYDAFGLFTKGHGVCQAFSLAFIALGQAWGLSVDMVTSLQMDHAWNHVSVNDSYYHVDVTRDLPNGEQDIRHDRCLLSDDALQALGYEGYTCISSHTCSTSIFEDETQDILFHELTGNIYPIRKVWLGKHPDHGLTTMLAPENELQIVHTVDVNLDGIESISDLMLCRLASEVPTSYLDMLRFQLILIYIKETASWDAVS